MDTYPTGLEKAAALLHSLTSHPFTDGNKRVAVYLKLKGARFDPAAEDEFFEAIAERNTPLIRAR